MKILAICTLAILCLVHFSLDGNITNDDLEKSAKLQKVLLNSGSRETVVKFYIIANYILENKLNIKCDSELHLVIKM